MLNLPKCPNHGGTLLLKNGTRGAFWYCPDECAHTQDFFTRSRRVIGVNGRDVRQGSMKPRGAGGTYQGRNGSKVEAQALEGEPD